jgi:hypothetical protein
MLAASEVAYMLNHCEALGMVVEDAHLEIGWGG